MVAVAYRGKLYAACDHILLLRVGEAYLAALAVAVAVASVALTVASVALAVAVASVALAVASEALSKEASVVLSKEALATTLGLRAARYVRGTKTHLLWKT